MGILDFFKRKRKLLKVHVYASVEGGKEIDLGWVVGRTQDELNNRIEQRWVNYMWKHEMLMNGPVFGNFRYADEEEGV